jgi:hypothetical protein
MLASQDIRWSVSVEDNCSHIPHCHACTGYFIPSASNRAAFGSSCSTSIIVVQTTHDRQGDNALAIPGAVCLHPRYAGNRLVDSLLRSSMIAVLHVLLEDTVAMTVVEDNEIV